MSPSARSTNPRSSVPTVSHNKWVALTQWGALPDREIRTLVRGSYDMVLSKLPKKVQSQLASEA